MGYYDGNTVTALWNYAQHYSMNDHSFGSTFGPSTPGAINLASGQTNGVINPLNVASAIVADGQGGFTDINDADPTGDMCSSTTANFSMAGKNIGDLLNAANITWGFFEGGFDLTVTNSNGTTGCGRSTRRSQHPWPSAQGRLHPAPSALPVLCQHGKPQPPPSYRSHRNHRPGQPPVRYA